MAVGEYGRTGENLNTHDQIHQLRMCSYRVLHTGIVLIPYHPYLMQECDYRDGITVKCPWNAQNGDAIDISSCKDVLIVNNTIDAGDDGICMKGRRRSRWQQVLVKTSSRKHRLHAHGGFIIGSEFSGGMKNIIVRNNTFQGTDTGLRFKVQ